MKYFKKISGEKCYLAPINIDDAELYTKWLNDLEVVQYLTLRYRMISLLPEKEVLERLSKEHNYGIVTNDEDKLIGNCGFVEVDNINRTCEIGIFIGDKEYWGKGLGTESLKLLISYGINYLNLRSFMLGVFSYNERAIKSYKKIGFKDIGARRKSVIFKNKEFDMLYMDLLSDEFLERNKN